MKQIKPDLIDVDEIEAFIKAARQLSDARDKEISDNMPEALDIALAFAKVERYEKALRDLTGAEYGFKAQSRAKQALEGK